MMSHTSVRVKDIMRDAHLISADVTYRDALTEMICKKTNSLVVVDDEGLFVGMINAGTLIEHAIPTYMNSDEIAAHYASEEMFRDAIAKVADMPITEFMKDRIVTITENESLMKAAIIATKNHQIRIPVLDDNKKPIGILTRTELKQVVGVLLGVDRCFEDIVV
jgi:CBS domain-containing protein